MPLQKSHKTALVLASLFAAGYFVFAGDHRALDSDLRELCENESSSVVYETITLPQSEFHGLAELKTTYRGLQPDGSYEKRVQDAYVIKSKSSHVKGWTGPPRYLFFPRGRIVKFESMVLRLHDSKLLAKSTTYARIGGAAALHATSKSCTNRPIDIVKQVFKPEAK